MIFTMIFVHYIILSQFTDCSQYLYKHTYTKMKSSYDCYIFG